MWRVRNRVSHYYGTTSGWYILRLNVEERWSHFLQPTWAISSLVSFNTQPLTEEALSGATFSPSTYEINPLRGNHNIIVDHLPELSNNYQARLALNRQRTSSLIDPFGFWGRKLTDGRKRSALRLEDLPILTSFVAVKYKFGPVCHLIDFKAIVFC